MNREQRLEDAVKALRQHLALFCGPDDKVANALFEHVDAALSAPKAEAVTVKPVAWRAKAFADGWIYTDSLYQVAKYERYGHAIQPLYTSPVPALTDEAVERAYEAAKNAMPHESLIEIAPGELERVVRAVLLAAFPSKGEGE